MNVQTARDWVRQFARDAGDSSNVSDAEIDRAILTVGQRFCRETRCLRTASTVTLTADSSTANIAAMVTAGFTPEQIIDAYIDGQAEPLSIVDYTDINARLSDEPATSVPQGIAFPTATTCKVYPTPDLAHVLTIRWWQAFTTWTPGDGASAGTSLSIPEKYLPDILTYGAPAVLQASDPKHKYASESWKKYLEYEHKMKSAGTLGTKVILRTRRT